MSSWSGVFKNSKPKIIIPSNVGSNSGGGGGSSPPRVTFGLVNNINYDNGSSHGFISYDSLDGGKEGQAAPLNPNITSYPIEGEVVLIINASSIRTDDTNQSPTYLKNTDANFYISSLNIWNNPSLNGMSSPMGYFPSNKNTENPPLSLRGSEIN